MNVRRTAWSRVMAWAIVVLGVLLAAPAPARAQGPGVRAGVSGDPDQFYFGAHYETDPLLDRLHFRPNLEIGIGDDATLVAINLEFAYHLPLRRTPWTLYVGAGPAANIFRRHGDTDTGGGFNFLIGVEHVRGLFTELKVGAIDSPSIKFGVGYTFR